MFRPALALVLAASACAHGDAGAVTVDASQSGRKVTVDRGGKVVVRLEANPTTGFAWTWANPSADVVAVGTSAYEPLPHAPGAVGTGGTQVFTFSAVAPGTTTLAFRYAKSWETDAAPARTVTFTVDVR